MLPIFRPASPWKAGSLILRTQDGKIVPYAPNSSEQAAWVDVGVAPMGAGKSVFLNAFNFAFISQPGLSRLPWLSVIDVGPSSSGLIYLLQEALPPHLRYLAAYHRLRMTPDYAVNPFDTPLGVRAPLPSHRTFLINFLVLLATPLNSDPDADAPGILQKAIDITYESLQKHGKLYDPLCLPRLHDFIVSDGRIALDAHTTWWEVVDALFDLGHIHEAVQAQRFAVPILDDLASVIRQNPGITGIYEEPVILSVWRSLMSSAEQYVILKQPTRFDLGDAQIVSLDLDEVAARGGDAANRQSAVMYLLARHVLGSRFFLMPSDVDLLPERYKPYHAARIEAIREDPKRLCYDEAHRVTLNSAVAGQMTADIQTIIRESRKWNLSVGIYTQSLDDLPSIIVDLATTVLLMGGSTDKSNAEIVSLLGLNDACAHALGRLGKPGAAGANFIGCFRTGSSRMAQLVLTLTIGSQSLWAFSTTTEDTVIRNELYKRFGVSKALQILSSAFPGGSAKSEVERRKRLVTDASDAIDTAVNVTKEIVDELSLTVVQEAGV
jgi:intracellular multiplication protein IcmB